MIAGVRDRRLAVVLVAVLVAATGLIAVSTAVEAAEPIVIYSDGPADGYQDWSWASVDIASSTEVRTGSAAMAVDFGPWEGVYLARTAPMALAGGGLLEFWMHGGTGAAGPIQVVLVDGSHNGGTAVTVETTPGEWTRYELPIGDFGASGTFGGLWWQNASAGDRSTIFIDDVRLVGAEEPQAPNADGPALTVDTAPRSITRQITDPAGGTATDQVLSFPHPISDGVYGMNFAAPTMLEEIRPGVNRWGGNAVERYNHQNGNTNLGKDWYFMNSPGEVDDADRFETRNQSAGADTLLTVPAIGWVAADTEARCGYPTDVYGTMDDTKPHFLDGSLECGNGRSGGQIVGNDPGLTSVAVGEDNTRDWVAQLVADHGSAADGGVEMYAIGNEPGLWHETHSDVTPAPVGRDEIIDGNLAHANAIKSTDPTAMVAGPVLWGGYSYYITSQELAEGRRPGDVSTFVADYLQAMADGESSAGMRLLDTLAVNFYDDRVFGGGTDELRLESTRNLWDPTYAPEDWWLVRDFVGEGNAVIPRLKSVIDQTYPGTELSITEYNFGGLDTMAGGLAQGDALGIFGREGVDRAILWDPFNEDLSLPEQQFIDRPAMWAFRMYRNYDGAGGAFGDRSLYAASDDQSVLSVYAAEREDGAITVMVINKSTTDQSSALSIPVAGTAEVYNYGTSDPGSIRRLDDLAVDGSVTTVYPARSMTLLVVDEADGTPTPPTAITSPPSTDDGTTVTSQQPNQTTTTATTAPATSTGDFHETFTDDDAMSRFESGIFHRDDFAVGVTSWPGDHQSTGPNDECSDPEETRTIERGDRGTGFNQDWIYRCKPGGDAALAHVMTSIGDTSGYSIGAFTPDQTFDGVTEVRWDVNITDLGTRQFTEVKIMPSDRFDFQNLPCAVEWLPCDTDDHGDLGSVGTTFFNGEQAINNRGSFTSGDSWDAGYRVTADDPARTSIRTRRTHFFRDNQDGTMTFGIEREDGTFETVTADGGFPEGPVKVVFADHNYTPTKDEPSNITFTWHWDDLTVLTNGTADPVQPKLAPTTDPVSNPTTNGPGTIPAGQPCVPGVPAGAIDGQPEFVGCQPLGPAIDTAVAGTNRWLDDFDHGQSFTDLRTPSYRMFDDLGVEGTVHWGHADHWMVDVATSGGTGGAMLSPDATFTFENGMLVVEADAAARHPDNVNAWPEIVISTGSEPGERRRNGLYGYDHFKGHHTLGCRLQLDSAVICSLMDDSDGTQDEGGREWEMSWFQHVGTSVHGGASFVDGGRYFRTCAVGSGDAPCRDRFRLELTSTSLTVYVNGFKYFEQTGIPELPDEFVEGELHVYFASMMSRHPNDALRFHWDRLAVNPTTGPSASPTFGQS